MQHDVVIVGGGPVGLTLSSALQPAAVNVALVNGKPAQNRSDSFTESRLLALSYTSVQILSRIGIWSQLEQHCQPVTDIHVCEQRCFGSVHLNAQELALPALGYSIPATTFAECLSQYNDNIPGLTRIPANVTKAQYQKNGMQLLLDNGQIITAKLLVAADGTHSQIRQQFDINVKTYDYQQNAIVCQIHTDRPIGSTAYERLTEHGPIALIPAQDKSLTAICVVEKSATRGLMQLADSDFSYWLQRELGSKHGNILHLGRRTHYPLQLVHARQQTQPHLVLLGNAAYTIHPNAAQGFNLCLRDAATLAGCIRQYADTTDISDPCLLQDYLKKRQHDQDRIIRFSHWLAQLYCSSALPKRILRQKILFLLAHNVTLRRYFTRILSGVDMLPDMLPVALSNESPG